MHPLLADTEYATSNLFTLLTEETHQLARLNERRSALKAESEAYDLDFRTSDLNDDFSDAHVMNPFVRSRRAHEQKLRAEAEIVEMSARIASHETATQALAGAILQIAKQLMSIVYVDIAKAPTGDMHGTVSTRDVIVAARNQSMHYEEGVLKNKTSREHFEALAATYGDDFRLDLGPIRSRAKEVLRVLKWASYEQYVVSMTALLGAAPASP